MDLVRPFAGPLFRSYRGLTEVPELAPSVLDSETRVGVNFCLSMMKLNSLQQYRTVRYLPLNDGGYGALHVAVTPGQFGQPLVRSWLEVARSTLTVEVEVEEEEEKETRFYYEGLFSLLDEEGLENPETDGFVGWYLEPNSAITPQGELVGQAGPWKLFYVDGLMDFNDPDIEWKPGEVSLEYNRPKEPWVEVLEKVSNYGKILTLLSDTPERLSDYTKKGTDYYRVISDRIMYAEMTDIDDRYFHYCGENGIDEMFIEEGTQVYTEIITAPVSLRMQVFITYFIRRNGVSEFTSCTQWNGEFLEDTEIFTCVANGQELYRYEHDYANGGSGLGPPTVLLPCPVTSDGCGLLCLLPDDDVLADLRIWGVAQGEVTELTTLLNKDVRLKPIIEAMGQEMIDGTAYTAFEYIGNVNDVLQDGVTNYPRRYFLANRNYAFAS